MKRTCLAVSVLAVLAAACSPAPTGDEETNPFTASKEDTGYVNHNGLEVHVTLESDIQEPSSRIFTAPAEQTQFATTYLRNGRYQQIYLEILTEDLSSPDRVEWLVDGSWLNKTAAAQLDPSTLTHFRIREVNAVMLSLLANRVQEGDVFKAKVPLRPLSINDEAGGNCAGRDSHMGLSQSVYWYLWQPDKAGCPQELVQTMTLTVEKLLPSTSLSYPEYDRLWDDKQLTVAVFFGKNDDGPVMDDYNWRNFDKLLKWLSEAGFVEDQSATLGRRLTKQVGDLTESVDLYGPDVFHDVSDSIRFRNWQQGVSEHEVVLYNGHSVLGTGYAFEEVKYPDFYQIFQVASCLSYEYYVRPILLGKGGWDKVDVISNVEPTSYYESFPLSSTFLAKLIWGFENGGQASWQDILQSVTFELGHARFGVSGARDNHFTP